ncbi:pyridoxamine 5'-phosphate oxidase family protein [Abyssalbus ytuae]|uniref:Pyridoxamine 5'-phosphate oxidase family protein n=1 Tax=Abyssalbus ytuae TaxID=2926907 RepID=A0A9E6ZN76_9FLAO|nr:pyridoxamine 5'-phosphate oxidase family protein [Abyssalbus ytuae]UOB17400.1 pyridoxamine 5'-phosphate oxidase family protein [Abyssalbus ytuae]
MKTTRSKIKRAPKRAQYDKESIYKILDSDFLCHVGIIHNDHPVVIPTLYGRKDDCIYIHGASVSRLITEIEKGIEVCISIANVKGLVLARSAFHHSANYESVVIFGKGELVSEEEKNKALKVISDQILVGRWEEVREPSDKELKATKVIKIQIEEVSAKVRTGDPVDDTEDYELDIWAGVLPVEKKFGNPVNDSKLKRNIEVSHSVKKAIS